MNPNISLSEYENLLRIPSIVDQSVVQKHIQTQMELDERMPNFERFFLMLDMDKLAYVFVSQGHKMVTGWDNELALQGGLQFLFQIIHPEDVELVIEGAHKHHRHFFDLFSPEEIKKLIGETSYRIRCANGEYIRILEQYCVVEATEEGRPVLCLIFVSKIENPRPQPVYAQVKILKENKYETLFYREFLPENAKKIDVQFSKREIEIIQLLAKGKRNAEIAAELFIASDTVKNHRKNILRKADCKNVQQLITLCVARGVIS